MTNMIQNYANNIGQGITSMNNTTKKYYNNFTDVNSESLLKPLDGKGYLVENNLLTAPVEMAKDSYYTTKALQKGIRGKANDHELGKLNDLGLKLGGLSIAAYLMTKRQTPKAKAMEFIGFGAFLASMAIWPKVALQWPAQLLHGVNFRKQYVDEQGRKKYLTQDPNYIPFDLMKGKKKNEDLNAIADKMGIAKDNKDRIDLAKEHVRKVSVQNNTLWMLTAGVATPVMTALACNRLEKPVGKFFEKHTNNKVNKLAGDIETYMTSANKELEDKLITKKMDFESEKALEGLLKSKTGSAISETDLTNITEVFTTGLDTQTQKAARADLNALLAPNKTIVNKDTVSNIADTLTKKLDTKYGEGFTSSLLDTAKLSEHVDNFMQANGNPANGVLEPDKAEKLRLSLGEMINESTKNLRPARQNVINSIAAESIEEVFAKNKAAVLTEDAASHISKAGRVLRKFRAFDETISSATHFKVEKAPETIAANNWSDVTETLMKELKITPKELKEAKSSEELSAQLLTRKLEELAKDEARYKKVVNKVASKMLELDTKLDNPGAGKRPVMNILTDAIIKNCDDTGSELCRETENSFQNLASRISGKEINGAHVGTVKQAKIDRIKQARVGGIQSAYSRLLHTMDFFKRAEEYKAGKGGFSGNRALDEALIARGKKLLVSSHSGDFYLKFQTANNVSFYKALMWHTFGSDGMSQASKEALNIGEHQVFGGKATMAQRVTGWAKHMRNLMGTNVNDFLKNHIEGEDHLRDIEKTAVEKFNKIASTPDNLLYNALKQKYNSNKWLKIFTTVGAIVLTGTLASQFAFGKKDK